MIAVHRLSQVDCLRAVAVLLVLGAHFQPPKPEDTGALVAVLTRTWMYGGWTGVDLFFVLSGFLVSGLLFREYQETGAVRPGRFLLRRGFKIYPAFYTMAIPILLLAQAPARQVVSELFLVQNYLLPNFFGYTWTLAVEEHFYLLLAAVVWCAVRYRPYPFRLLPAACAVVAVGCLAARIATVNDPSYGIFDRLIPTHLRIDSLMFGVLLSYGWHFGQLRQRTRGAHWWLLALGVSLLAPAFVVPLSLTWWMPVYGFTLCYLGAGALLIGALNLNLPDSRLVRGFARIGTYSYSIYLWHGVANIATRPMLSFGIDWQVYAVAYVIGAGLLGILTAKLIEMPALAIRDRYFPARRAPSRQPAAAA